MHRASKFKVLSLLVVMTMTLPSVAQVHSVGVQCYADTNTAYQILKKQQKIAKRININTATASDFLTLQGVGVNTAEKIIKHRAQIGRFHHVDDLMQVKGIGQAILDKNRHRLSVLD